ncbi:MAG: class I SAM-dependent methyltransferase [Roseofilum sp. SID2]|uniref:class I SAM-dependent methyltransferase n=1 Tax=unclassified Roseofilum TaxID=2620099 RepID=UPI001B095020|nr:MULTISPECIES: class I SAM-dependent methyltransferase [unclassified Roseofilum]MBP0012698.1 class I SAM-dependent methyltransferase [Roseofilum sp. SID3]MBP0026335.1 class I SAM-dependent methyltransferase [Roseofilum sp. SID2]MBP0040008.1 class I SAM-dependent methyltransferase [Roseofilum sp. SID1]
MNDQTIDAFTYTLVREYLADGLPGRSSLNTRIHPQDEMLLFLLDAQSYQGKEEQAVLAYFKSAQEIVDRVDRAIAWHQKSWTNIDRFLEFACGYGRLTRFWVEKLAPDKVWASDIYTNAVDFVSQELGVHGIDSVVDPKSYHCDEKFNCILVYSLFSHLPENRFGQWLSRLYDLLLPGGLLLFSVHDRAVQPPGYTMPESGILFVEQSESQSLDRAEYGSSWVTEDFVKRAIATSMGNEVSYTRFPRAFTLQDLYVVVKTPNCDFSDLKIDFTPKGALEDYFMDDRGRFFLRGWSAIVQPDHGVAEIQVWCKGKQVNRLLQRCIPSAPSQKAAQVLGIDPQWTEKSGWSCVFSLPEEVDLETAVIMIKAVSDRQKERIIVLNWMKTLLPEGIPTQCVAETSWKQVIQSQSNWWRAKILDNIWSNNIQANLDRATLKPAPNSKGVILELEGWVVVLDSDITIEEVQIFLNGTLKQRCLPTCVRPDVAQYWGKTNYIYSGWIAECYQQEEIQLERDRLSNAEHYRLQIKIIDSEGEIHTVCDRLLATLLSK